MCSFADAFVGCDIQTDTDTDADTDACADAQTDIHIDNLCTSLPEAIFACGWWSV